MLVKIPEKYDTINFIIQTKLVDLLRKADKDNCNMLLCNNSLLFHKNCSWNVNLIYIKIKIDSKQNNKNTQYIFFLKNKNSINYSINQKQKHKKRRRKIKTLFHKKYFKFTPINCIIFWKKVICFENWMIWRERKKERKIKWNSNKLFLL